MKSKNASGLSVLVRKTKVVLNDPKVLWIKLLYLCSPLFDDEFYLKILFRSILGYPLDLENPKTFNEKLNWMKLNLRKDIFTKMVDKYEVKFLVADLIGEEYVVENLGVWEKWDHIDFDSLPEQFVLKTTHNSGGVIIINDKNKMDFRQNAKKLKEHLRHKHFFLSREWPYKNVKPKIIAERLLENSEEILTYKFFCFNGKARLLYVSKGRHLGQETFNYFDMNFNPLNIVRKGNPPSEDVFEKPFNWQEMVNVAEKLADPNLPFIRVDLFNVSGRVFFNEFTFYSEGGFGLLFPSSWDLELGRLIRLEAEKRR